jgi:hypothetical protein
MVEYVWKRSGREQRRGADTHRAHRFLPSPIVERAGVKSTVMLSLKKAEAGATASVALSLPRPVSIGCVKGLAAPTLTACVSRA